MTFPRKRVAVTVAAVALTGLLAACSSGSETPAGGGGQTIDPETPVAITVGTLAAGDYAPLYIAQQEGFFEEENLEVTIEIIAGGSVGMTQLASGDLDFSAATWTNVLAAVSQGLEVQVVREGSNSAKEGINGVVVQAGSGIDSIDDLRGQTLSVNTLQSATEVMLRDCLATGGLEPDEYTLVEVPFPEVGAAVSQGRIVAGFVPEPFVTIGGSQGLENLFYPSVCNENQESSPIVTWNTSRSFAEQNPAAVEAFVRAMDKATQLAIDDEQVVRDILPTYTTLTPELASAITTPSYTADGTPNLDGAELTMELMLEYGLLEEPLEDLSQYAWQGE